MRSTLAPESETLCDASLVEQSLSGDREAFGQIVARYQSPICALAYSACGNVSRSEDIAQEVFITAWRKLSSLQEPARFKAWLYGIARNLIHNAFRQYTRNPVAGATALDATDEQISLDAKPDAETISKEEEAILWNVLSGLPEIYREPMVLFYRENESTSGVADTLSISEETVRQRLSRGRALLSERVSKIVEIGLRSTKPSDAFTVAVIAGLPAVALSTTAQGAVVGVAATKSTTGSATGAAGFLKGIGMFAGMIAVPMTLGLFFGNKLAQDTRGNAQQRKSAERFWRIFTWGVVLLIFLPLSLTLGLTGFLRDTTRGHFLSAMTIWLGLAYPFVLGTICVWAWQRKSKDVEKPTQATAPITLSKRMLFFVTLAAAAVMVFCFFDMRRNVVRVSTTELHQIIERSDSKTLRASISAAHYRSMWGQSAEMYRHIFLEATKGGKKTTYLAKLDEKSLAMLAARSIACPTYVQGKDYEVLGTPGRFLPLLAAFILGNGGLFLVKRHRVATTV